MYRYQKNMLGVQQVDIFRRQDCWQRMIPRKGDYAQQISLVHTQEHKLIGLLFSGDLLSVLIVCQYGIKPVVTMS